MIPCFYFLIFNFFFFQSGWTALMYASYKGYVEVIRLLLSHSDININIKDIVRND
jgi:ankyrin repeat protein